jgi:hypothetical protein
MGVYMGNSSICIDRVNVMNNKQTQRKPVNAQDYKRILTERVKSMNPSTIAIFAQTLDVLQQIERLQHDTNVQLTDIQRQITLNTELSFRVKWYDVELRKRYRDTLRGLIQRNNALHSMLNTYNHDATNTRNALDVLITTIKRG